MSYRRSDRYAEIFRIYRFENLVKPMTKNTRQDNTLRLEDYKWPPRPTFNFYNGWGKLLIQENNSHLDLADTLMLSWPKPTRVVYMGILSRGTSWPTWTEERLQHIERLIKYDLGFDAYSVSIKRVTQQRRLAGSNEFRWKLQIRETGDR